MSSIGIITIHFGTNYGSALQAYALTSFLKKAGFDAKIIDYIPRRYKLWNTYFNEKKANHGILPILFYWPFYAVKQRRIRRVFERFINKEIPKTKTIHKKKHLNELNSSFDLFVAGSDQIWNPFYNKEDNDVYYLTFANETKKRISYAGSFGSERQLDKHEIGLLSKLNCISVREKSAQKMLFDAGIEGTHVCDPTFLLSKEDWLLFSKKSDLKVSSNYVLVYVMDGEWENLIEIASKVCEKKGLRLFTISFSNISSPLIDKQFVGISPYDFVYLFLNASYIVTNSFHGTAFSLIADKECIILGKKQFNTRMISLLEKAGLQERFVCSSNDFLNKIDLASETKEQLANKNKLNEWIDKSKKWLMDAINNDYSRK